MKKELEKELDRYRNSEVNIINVYFDMEFTGLIKDTDVISIGLITNNGEFFYGEITDYDKSKCTDWIKENVINNLLFKGEDHYDYLLNNSTYVSGTKEKVSIMLREWLASLITFDNDVIQFVSDVCHYDFVLLIDLLSSNALLLPDYISPVCIDINPMIAKEYGLYDYDAFMITREYLSNSIRGTVQSYYGGWYNKKHNSMWDAYVIMEIYHSLYKTEEPLL